MAYFFKNFRNIFAKAPKPGRVFKGATEGYVTLAAIFGTSKFAYTVGKVGIGGAAAAVLASFKLEAELVILKERMTVIEEKLMEGSIQTAKAGVEMQTLMARLILQEKQVEELFNNLDKLKAQREGKK